MIIRGWEVRDLRDGDELPREIMPGGYVDSFLLVQWLVPALPVKEATRIARAMDGEQMCTSAVLAVLERELPLAT